MTASQSQAAQRIYNGRASTYEDSWHPAYSRRMMELIPVQLGDKVIVACCGTGLESLIAARRVGPAGVVVGIDVSAGMLAKAHAALKRDSDLGPRTRFLQHDATDFEGCEDQLEQLGLGKGSLDLLICSNAFVLLNNPAQVVAHWKMWLKEGGTMAIDVPHEQNLVQGLLIEEVATEMGLEWPSNRRWVRDKDSLRSVLEDEGMVVERVETVQNVAGLQVFEYGLDDANKQFDSIISSPFAKGLHWTEEEAAEARQLFSEKWKGIAKGGKVEVVDALYLYIARKP